MARLRQGRNSGVQEEILAGWPVRGHSCPGEGIISRPGYSYEIDELGFYFFFFPP